jgi:DNA primase
MIKDSIDPYDFYLRELDICRYGYQSHFWVVAGLCPFHDDSRAGSFKVNTHTGAFKCWSCGASGGDIISFLQQRDGLEFREALEQLAEQWEVDPC